MPDLAALRSGGARVAHALDFLIVFFDGDRRQLDLFGAGFARFVPENILSSITLIYNGTHTISAQEADDIRAVFGPHHSKVRLILRSIFLASPRDAGWKTQQILKLTATAASEAQQVVILDTKNVFCKPIDSGYFITPDGRCLCDFCDFSGHPMEAWLTATLAFFGLDLALVKRFPQTVTPFVMDTDVVRDLLSLLDACAVDLDSVFDETGVTEFFLYAAYVKSRSGNLDTHFAKRGFPHGLTIWPDLRGRDQLARSLDDLHRTRTSIFSVHRQAMPKLSGALADLVAEFWVDCGLFASPAKAHTFIKAFRDDPSLK